MIEIEIRYTPSENYTKRERCGWLHFSPSVVKKTKDGKVYDSVFIEETKILRIEEKVSLLNMYLSLQGYEDEGVLISDYALPWGGHKDWILKFNHEEGRWEKDASD